MIVRQDGLVGPIGPLHATSQVRLKKYQDIFHNPSNSRIIFTVRGTLLTKQRVRLVCDGLDTVSTVYINNIQVGSSDNMFVRYEYDIKYALKVE